MGRRSDIDWEKVEKLYIANQLTIQQIADECGVATSSIKLRAKNHGWGRDFSAAIRARSMAKIAAIDVNALIEDSASKTAGQSAALIQSAIEHAADVAAGVVVRHRADIRLQMERGQTLESLVDDMASKPELSIADVSRLSQSYKALVDARGKLITLERQAFRLDSESDAGGSVADSIRKALAE